MGSRVTARWLLVLALVGAGGLSLAQSPSAPPAAEGRFRSWLAAFNDADEAALQAFAERAHATRGAHQQFRLVPQGDGQYQLIARHSGKCIEVPASSADGVQLQQRTCDGTTGQSFRLAAVSGKGGVVGIEPGVVYALVNKAGGKCVEIGAAGVANGTPIQQSTCRSDATQHWQLSPTYDDQHHRLQPVGHPAFGLEVAGGPPAIADGAKVDLWRSSASPEGDLGFREMTGGFDVRKVEESEATRFVALVEERENEQFARATVEVEPAAPYRVTHWEMRVVPRPAEFAIPRLSEKALVEALRARLAAEAAADRFSGTVVLARDGKVLLSAAHGLADRDKKIPNTPGTRFRVGSMNKMFTGTAVLQLVQAGKVRLEDAIGKYLTDYPNKDVATKVTVHHLLTHTGGTGDIFGPLYQKHRLELRTLHDYVKLYGSRGLEHEPGARFAYSNYGMVLAGLVVEKASGMDYHQYIRERVFKPAGMTGSGAPAEDEAVADRSVGYMNEDGRWRPNVDTLPPVATSAGGGISTAEDLARFAFALTSHKLLDAAHTELLTTGKVEAGRGRYAYGFDDATVDGLRSIGHGGGAPGMNGDLRIYPATGYVIAVLSNLDPPAAERVSRFAASRVPAADEPSGIP